MKVCLLGGYKSGAGYHWRGQLQAFQKLGHEVFVLDIRRQDWDKITRTIIRNQPDLLWMGLKECMQYLYECAPVRNLHTEGKMKTVFWFGDLRPPEGFEKGTGLPIKNPRVNTKTVGKHLDLILLMNEGFIEQYKLAYRKDQVYYMPLACTPEWHHPEPLTEPPEYDIAFAGYLDSSVFHRGRTELVKKLQGRYKVLLDNLRGREWDDHYIRKFYSKAKLALGIDILDDGKLQYRLSTSNRIWIATACGTCFLQKRFEGIDLLAKNHRDLIWWETEKELYGLIERYLQDEAKRQFIQRNAWQWAHMKHTYIHRINNVLDILHGKETKFRGFLETPVFIQPHDLEVYIT